MAEEQRAQGESMLAPFVPYVTTLGAFTVGAIVLVNVLNAYAIVAGPRENERYWYLLVEETNPSTWLSVTMLSSTALLAGVCLVVDLPRRRPFWSLVMAALFAMSLDDAAIVHERVGGNIGSAVGESQTWSWLWVVPWAAVAIGVGIALWRMRPRLPPRTRNQLIGGAAVTVGAAVVLEVLPIWTVNRTGSDTANLVFRSVEENLELIGVLVIAHALARHALDASRSAPTMSREDAG